MRSLSVRTPGLLVVLSFALWAPAPASAQEPATRQVTLDVSLLSAAVGVGWPIGPGRVVGFELGAGLPYLSTTLAPGDEAGADPEFGEFLHAALFARFTGSGRYSIDVGVRGSIADLWPCPASDCYPVPFAGLYAQPMVAWGPVSLGGRFTAGWIGETRPSSAGRTFLVAVMPIVLRWSF